MRVVGGVVVETLGGEMVEDDLGWEGTLAAL